MRQLRTGGGVTGGGWVGCRERAGGRQGGEAWPCGSWRNRGVGLGEGVTGWWTALLGNRLTLMRPFSVFLRFKEGVGGRRAEALLSIGA